MKVFLKKLESGLLKAMIFAIRFYQVVLSPWKVHCHCRYIPTCSAYAIEALKKHGLLKGTALAVWRILRCNPFSKGGFDPVP